MPRSAKAPKRRSLVLKGEATPTLPQAAETAPHNQSGQPSTPIAAELQNHFARGGSAADGVRLVELLERTLLSAASTRSRTGAREFDGLPLRTKPAGRRRSTELPDDWAPSIEDLQYARSEGLSDELIRREVEKFRDYWPNAPAGRRTKRDWAATWRNWVRRTADDFKQFQNNGTKNNAAHRGCGGFAINTIALTRRHAS
jgi:hypothetical protein